MKIIPKIKIIKLDAVNSILEERELLMKIDHPFIVKMHFSFQDKNNLYIISELMPGGDLRKYYVLKNNYNEKQCQFIAACIILALEYLHTNKIIHRDIKPENIVFDEKGYAKITDFGISKDFSKKRDSIDLSGSPGYACPEVVFGKAYSYPCDYFSLGVICYEMMLGVRPYIGCRNAVIKEKMMGNEVMINQDNNKLSDDAKDFINQLIKLNPEERLGYNGFKEIIMHKWFLLFDWKSLYLRKMESPVKNRIFDIRKMQIFNVKYNKINLKDDKVFYPQDNLIFKNFGYFNRYSPKFFKLFEETLNPHEIFNEIEKKENEFLKKLKNDDEIYLRAKRNKSLTIERSRIGRSTRQRFLGPRRIKNSTNEKYLCKRGYDTEKLKIDHKTIISRENKDY